MTDTSILIVDDVPENLTLLASILRGDGHTVRVSPSGQLALRSVRQHPPDLILLDIRMPGMDGFEVCERLKAAEETAEIPIIFLTAQKDEAHRIRAFEQGAADYVTKPFSAEEVCARVRTHLHLSRALRDLAAEKEAAEEQLRQLRRTERVRDELIRMIVHDMRTPLTAVLLIAEGLLHYPFDEQWQSDVEDLVASSRRLDTMVRSVLDMGQLQHDQMPLTQCPVSVAEVADEAAHGARRLDYRPQIRTEVPEILRVHADRDLLTRVLENLLVNALKYSPGDAEVVVGAEQTGDDVTIWVVDGGPGIPEAQRETLFDPFVGGHDTDTPSWGLGLSFCRMAVERHEGKIGVDPGPGGAGSKFWFALPTAGVEPVQKGCLSSNRSQVVLP